MSATEQLLPAQFSDLEPFVAKWSAATMAGRMQRRFDSTPEEREAFYSALVPRADEVITCLSQVAYSTQLPPAEERLFRLLLALAEISLTVEVNGQEVEGIHARSNRLINVVRELDGR
jgi:hypothetical protein